MAHLWIVDDAAARGDQPAWVMHGLDGAAAVPLPVERAGSGGTVPHAALLLCSRTAAGAAWLIMTTGAAVVALNGTPLRAGIRVLADRDEIRVAGFGTMYFATERLAHVELFPGADRRVDCPRCKQEIVAGYPAVRCPACGRWFHHSDELPCWTYASTCLCPQPTGLDAGYQWTPVGL